MPFGPAAIAVVEEVDAQFFEHVRAKEALGFLRRLVRVPESGELLNAPSRRG
jgi:hypothetical protein